MSPFHFQPVHIRLAGVFFSNFKVLKFEKYDGCWWEPEAYLEPSLTSAMEHFCENNSMPKAINCFRKKAVLWIFKWIPNTPLRTIPHSALDFSGDARCRLWTFFLHNPHTLFFNFRIIPVHSFWVWTGSSTSKKEKSPLGFLSKSNIENHTLPFLYP